MKPKLTGDLAALYEQRTTLRRKTKTFNGVEWVDRYISCKTGGPTYRICICGVNGHGVRIAAYYYPGESTAYIWQYAHPTAVDDIMANPENAYNWRCVKNGLCR